MIRSLALILFVFALFSCNKEKNSPNKEYEVEFHGHVLELAENLKLEGITVYAKSVEPGINKEYTRRGENVTDENGNYSMKFKYPGFEGLLVGIDDWKDDHLKNASTYIDSTKLRTYSQVEGEILHNFYCVRVGDYSFQSINDLGNDSVQLNYSHEILGLDREFTTQFDMEEPTSGQLPVGNWYYEIRRFKNGTSSIEYDTVHYSRDDSTYLVIHY